METNMPTSAEILIKKLQDAVAQRPSNRDIIAAHAEFLRDSEEKLIAFMRGEQPAPDAPGDVDFGYVLYQLNQSPPGMALEASASGGLYATLGIPASRLVKAPVAAEGIFPIVTNDGSLIGPGKWEALDGGWLEAFGNYILLKLGKITIHLGDVYYSGTQDEESGNFVSDWTPAKRGALMLNSNHEMYDGANGYFDI